MVRGQVVLVRLDPTVGREMKKTRPVVIVSPDALNRKLGTVTIVPLTSNMFPTRFRVPCAFAGKSGQLAPDHIRGIDKSRILKVLGPLEPQALTALLAVLQEMFAP